MGTHTIEKIYDESRAAFRSQIAVEGFSVEEDSWYEQIVGKYWYSAVTADTTLEIKCWAATESIIERLHESDATIGPPMPPLYQEVCMDLKIFEARQASTIEKIQLKPRFDKRTRQSLMDWLSAHELGVQNEDLFEEIQVAHVKMSKAYLVNLCERVWNAL